MICINISLLYKIIKRPISVDRHQSAKGNRFFYLELKNPLSEDENKSSYKLKYKHVTWKAGKIFCGNFLDDPERKVNY